MSQPTKVITIAGSDTSGGAGIQADVKVFSKYNFYSLNVITSIVTQTPREWTHEVHPIDSQIISKQLDTACNGVGRIQALKTGLLPTIEILQLVGKKLNEVKNDIPIIVIDPVLKCKGDDSHDLLETKQMVDGFIKHLLPLATLVTPNLFEAGSLAKTNTPKTLDEIKQAAKIIHGYGVKNVVIKGFNEGNKSIDILFDGSNYKLIENEYINTKYNHGTGCTFSSCCTAELAKNPNGSIEEVVTNAKKYVTEQLRTSAFKLNDHVGTISHK
jgi:pyridoxine kinase